jgi:hypothetical protein
MTCRPRDDEPSAESGPATSVCDGAGAGKTGFARQMRLTVVAREAESVAEPAGSGYTVRLSGMPAPGDVLPSGLTETADAAMSIVQKTFPEWLWTWAQRSDVLGIATFPGPISWWWYAAISEMSPTRSPLLRDLYRLVLLRRLIEQHAVRHVTWIGDDSGMARAAGAVVRAQGAGFDCTVHQSGRRGLLALLAARLFASVSHVCRCLALRATGFGRVGPKNPDVLLYSRYPVLWETCPEGMRDRMFAGWPQFLTRQGTAVGFGAVFSGSAWSVVTNRRQLRRGCEEYGIILVEALTSLGDLLSAHFDLRFAARYIRWRRQHRESPAVFDGADVSELFWRDIDADALSFEVAHDRLLERAVGRALDKASGVKAVCLPFEYQPMERAVTVAAQKRGIPVIGVQTCLFASNKMGFTFTRSQVRTRADDPERAPLPDLLAAYGELPYRTFVERLGTDRVCLSGPIRYGDLAHRVVVPREKALQDLGLAGHGSIILVATSADPAEARPMLDAVFSAVRARPNAYVVLKCHYLLPLHQEAQRLARRYGVEQFRVVDASIGSLLSGADVMICGGSSTGIEAMAHGCMPLVLRLAGELSFNPTLEVPGAAFFWQTPAELERALTSALAQDGDYLARRAQWPAALREQLSPIVSDAYAGLYSVLRSRGVMSGPARVGSSHVACGADSQGAVH